MWRAVEMRHWISIILRRDAEKQKLTKVFLKVKNAAVRKLAAVFFSAK